MPRFPGWEMGGAELKTVRSNYTMHRGYVKVYRKLEDSGILKDPHACQFFMWAMLKATHKPHQQPVGNQVIDLEPGQFISGRKAASLELGISEMVFRGVSKKMENLDFITIKPTNKFSIFTIINWDTYQNRDIDNNQQSNQQVTNKQPTDNQQVTTNKNAKNIKNEETYIPEHLSEYADFARNFQHHVQAVNGAKAPAITDALIKKCAEEVDKLIRIDGQNLEQIKSTMRWAVKDDFWSSNAMSLAALRKKGDDGRTKFQKILAAKDRSTPVQRVQGTMLTFEQMQAMVAVN